MIGKVTVPVSSVTLYHTINTLPYAEFSVALDGAPAKSGLISIGGVQIDLSKMNQLGKALQEKFYNSFSLEPDIKLDIWDGDGEYDETEKAWGNHIQFVGFLGNPSFQVQNGQFMMVITALHSMAKLQAFNSVPYSPLVLYGTNQDVAQDVLGDLKKFDDSVTDRLMQLITVLMKKFDTVNMNNPEYEPDMQNVHALNKMLMKSLQTVFDKSSMWTMIDGLTDGDGNLNTLFSNIPLHRSLYDLLFNAPSILDTFTGMLPVFMFQMNATWAVDSLWLEHQQLMEVPRSMIVAPIQVLNFSLASMFEVPTLQVIVRGPASAFYANIPTGQDGGPAPVSPSLSAPTPADAAAIQDQSQRLLVRFPSKVMPDKNGSLIPGKYVYLDAPYWVTEDATSFDADVVSDLTTSSADPRFSVTQNNLAKIIDRLDTSKVRSRFLNYLARYNFKDIFLNRTTARINIPLCLTPQVGRTYFLRASGESRSMYIGYLQSVTHTLVISETGATADTALTFTHIISRDATLNPVSLGDVAYTPKALDDAEQKLMTSGKTSVSPV